MVPSELIKKNSSFISITGSDLPEFLDFETDSRKIQKDQSFIALYGPNHNGFGFVDSVISNGAKVIIFEDTENNQKLFEKNFDQSISWVKVKNIFNFIESLAFDWINLWKSSSNTKKVIGLTGSNGKTTCKNILLHILSALFPKKVHGTAGNFNNLIGLPLTIFKLSYQHDFLIAEIGTNNFGEIKKLSKILCPDFGYISNIGDAHLEFLKNREGVFSEKSELANYIKNNGQSFLINTDDLYLKKIEKIDGWFETGDFQSLKVENTHLVGEHNIKNLKDMVIFSKVICDELSFEKIIKEAKDFIPTKNRSSWIHKDGVNYFLDAYNANPSSMATSLKGFCKNLQNENCLVVLGDMNELGDSTEKMHKGIGELLNELKVTRAYFVGKYSGFYSSTFKGKFKVFKNVDELIEFMKENKERDISIFVKGSRTLQLEKIVE